MANPTDEINGCMSLFLTEIQELGCNSLRLVVSEGLPAGAPESVTVGDITISGCTPVKVTAQSRVFELVWEHYVGYAVLNESFASVNGDEQFVGTRFRIYSKSRFLDYMSQSTFASELYPGPTKHYCVVCEDHIVEVLSVGAPMSTRVQ